MPGFISDSPLARKLIRIGDEAIVRENDAKLRDYFADDYVFHGPDGELSFNELCAYFASLRAAFSNLQIIREQIIVDGNFLAARNTFSGDFTSVFTHSPIGPLEPTGQHVNWEVINTFRYNDDGRLAEEWVQTDYRGFLTKLGVSTSEHAPREKDRQINGDTVPTEIGDLMSPGSGSSNAPTARRVDTGNKRQPGGTAINRHRPQECHRLIVLATRTVAAGCERNPHIATR